MTVTRSGGQFRVSWKDDPTAPQALITSSTVTATPVGSASPVFKATAGGTTSSALLGPLEPNTIYQITVASADAAGSSAASAPASITTGASTVPPGAPTGVSAYRTAPASRRTLVARWKASAPGDSSTDKYQVSVTGSDGGGTYTQTVSGSTLTVTFAVNDIPDWTIEVRAHDAAGWGPWSAPYTLGGT